MIAKDAFRFLVPLLVMTLVALALHWTVAGVVLFGLAAFVAFFFRNPKRRISSDPKAIVSPADGRVVKLERIGNVTRMSIFLSIFNVHVNRSPIAGRIEAIDYKAGKFKAAYDPAASLENERNTILVTNADTKIVFTQIAGIVARRIVCWKKAGDMVEKGELIGLIRFGSRVDVLFPSNADIIVKERDFVRGGSTVIGRIR